MSHNKGIDSAKSSWVGKTACQSANLGLVSSESSAARRPWTVMGPIALEMDFGTVCTVLRAEMGTFNNVSPACCGC